MKLDEFTEALTEALVCRGVPGKVASSNVERLTSHLDSAALKFMDAYSSKEDLSAMADELSEKLLRRLSEENEADGGSGQDSTGTGDDRRSEMINDAISKAFGVQEGDEDSAVPSAGDGIQDASENSAATSAGDSAQTTPEDTVASAGNSAQATSEDSADTPAGDIESTEPEGAEAGSDDTYDWDDIDLVASVSAGPAAYDLGDTTFTLTDTDILIDREQPAAEDAPDITDAVESVPASPPDDGLSEYAPDAGMLTAMGLADSKFTAEDAGGHRKQNRLELPPLPEIYETPEGKKGFTTAALCLSPVILIAAVLYFAAWGVVFAAEAALTAALIASLVAVAAGGTLASVTGIIYGIVRLSDRHGEGVFEIGLGIVVIGATLLAGVLIYNAAIRFMPWAMKQTAYLCRYCSRYVHILIRRRRGRFSEK